MDLVTTQMILFGLCLLAGIVFLIFLARNNDKGINYDKLIGQLNKQKDIDLNILTEKNKEINQIEEKILKCKKKLKMKLFDND